MTIIVEDATSLADASTAPARKTTAGKRKPKPDNGTPKAGKTVAAKAPASGGVKAHTSAAPATKPKGSAKREVPPSLAGATKAEIILKLLRRKKGATIAERQEATGWQAHSVRGFLSASVKKRRSAGMPTRGAMTPVVATSQCRDWARVSKPG